MAEQSLEGPLPLCYRATLHNQHTVQHSLECTGGCASITLQCEAVKPRV